MEKCVDTKQVGFGELNLKKTRTKIPLPYDYLGQSTVTTISICVYEKHCTLVVVNNRNKEVESGAIEKVNLSKDGKTLKIVTKKSTFVLDNDQIQKDKFNSIPKEKKCSIT